MNTLVDVDDDGDEMGGLPLTPETDEQRTARWIGSAYQFEHAYPGGLAMYQQIREEA